MLLSETAVVSNLHKKRLKAVPMHPARLVESSAAETDDMNPLATIQLAQTKTLAAPVSN